jgi:hypothetical protein
MSGLRICLTWIFLSVAAFCAPAWAGHDGTQMIALHLKAHTTKASSICTSWAPSSTACDSFVTAGQLLTHYDVYVVAVDPDTGSGEGPRGIAGLQWGMNYNGTAHQGIDIISWTTCGDLEWSQDNWPTPKTGNIVTWGFEDNCQVSRPGTPGVQAIAGSFYVYAYTDDILSVVPIQWGMEPNVLKVANCGSAEYNLDPSDDRGAIQFSSGGALAGFNPCTGNGVLPPYLPAGNYPATWGSLKAKY